MRVESGLFAKQAVCLFQLIDVIILFALFPGCFHLRHRQAVVTENKPVNIIQIGMCAGCQRIDKGGVIVVGLHKLQTKGVGMAKKNTPDLIDGSLCGGLGEVRIQRKDYNFV